MQTEPSLSLVCIHACPSFRPFSLPLSFSLWEKRVTSEGRNKTWWFPELSIKIRNVPTILHKSVTHVELSSLFGRIEETQ